MQIEINGKKVVLRDRLPAQECWPVLASLRRGLAGQEPSFDEEAQVLAFVVEEWEFEGDPHDPTSYATLDLLSEFLPLDNAIGRYLAQKLGVAKNSPEPPTSR